MQIKGNLKMQKLKFWRFTSSFRARCEMCSLGQIRIEMSSSWARCGAHWFKEKQSSTEYKSMAAVLLEELVLLWPREPKRLDMMKNEKDLVFWKENALKNALKMKKMKRCEWKIQKMPRICNRSGRGAHHLITGIRLYAWGARHVKIGACLLPSEKEEKRWKRKKMKKHLQERSVSKIRQKYLYKIPDRSIFKTKESLWN